MYSLNQIKKKPADQIEIATQGIANYTAHVTLRLAQNFNASPYPSSASVRT